MVAASPAAAGRGNPGDPGARRLLGRARRVGGITLLSRVSGLLRESMIAALFGASSGMAADAFYMAFRIPNLLRRLFAEGAVSVAVVPILARRERSGGRRALDRAERAILSRSALALMAMSVLGMLLAPWILRLFAPGYDDAKRALTIDLLRLLFPFLFLVGMTAMVSGYLHTRAHFAAPAFAPVLLNTGIIAAAMLLASRIDPPVLSLPAGVLAGGLAGLALVLLEIRRCGFRFRPVWERGAGEPREMLHLLVPVTAGVAVHQCNVLVASALASTLPDGNVAWLFQSDRLIEFPLGLVAVSIATVSLPSFARAEDTASLRRHLRLALRLVLFVCLPATAGLLALRLPIVSLVLQRGRFLPADTVAVARILLAAAPAIPAIAVARIVAQVFYARGEAKVAVRAAAGSFLVNALAGFLLLRPLGAVGLALASSAAAYVNLIVLALALRRSVGSLADGDFLLPAVKALVLAAGIGIVLAPVASLGVWLEPGRLLAKLSGVLGAVLLGGGLYLAAGLLLGLEDAAALLHRAAPEEGPQPKPPMRP